MKKYLSMVKRWDIIIILSLCILSFLPIAIFSYVKANEPAPANGKKELVAVISVDSKEYKTVTLTGHKGTESFDVKQPDGHTNTIEVSGKKSELVKRTVTIKYVFGLEQLINKAIQLFVFHIS